MIFVLYNVLNEVHNLPRSVESVRRVYDDVTFVFVDGKYPDFPGYLGISQDGTRDYARDNGYLVTSINYECEKRTAGLRFIDDLATEGDWVLYLDADEVLTEINALPQRVGYISFSRDSNPEVEYGRCRLYKWEPGLQFKHRHYDLYDSDENLVASLEDAPQYDFIGSGIHYDRSHSKERRELKRPYYTSLRARETHPGEVPVGG